MLKQFIFILITCNFLTVSAYAKDWHVGVKLAYIEPDNSIVVSDDNADNAGIVLGYNWLKSYGTIGVEADYTTSFLDGATEENGVTPINEAFFIDTLGLYAVYKTIGHSNRLAFYGKLKAGALHYKITNLGTIDEDELEFSAGIGLGWNVGNVAFEIDYTIIKDFNMFSLTILL